MAGVLIPVLLLLAFLLEFLFAEVVDRATIAPDFVLATVATLAVTGRAAPALGGAAAGGLLKDALSSGYVGLNGISKLVVCRSLQNASAQWPPIPPAAFGLIAVLAALADGLLYALAQFVAGGGAPTGGAVQAFLLGVPVSALYGCLLHAACAHVRALSRYPAPGDGPGIR